MDGTQRINIKIGAEVRVVQKHHQGTGELTEGIVKRILTKSSLILMASRSCWRM
ncbi:MAG: DUF2196 domain-containing protein, partial [Cyclobacteriaceae bacterium]